MLPVLSPQEESPDLVALRESMADTQPVGSLLSCAKTLDQVFVLSTTHCCLYSEGLGLVKH